MHLICPQCRQEITGEDVNIKAAVAKCPSCHAVFGFNASNVIGQAVLSYPRPASPKPAHLNVDESGRDVKVWWGWFQWSLLPMAGFCILWNGFLVVWYSIVISQFWDPQPGGEIIWLAAVFPVLHVAVGVTLAYATVTGFLNSTTLEVSGGLLTVRHGPIPSWGNIDLDTKSITQLYCTTQGAHAQVASYRWQKTDTFDLVALLDDGTTSVILSGQPDAATVWYLEQLLEKYLKIEDERVGGEYVG